MDVANSSTIVDIFRLLGITRDLVEFEFGGLMKLDYMGLYCEV